MSRADGAPVSAMRHPRPAQAPRPALRELLAAGPILEHPSVCDPFGARMAEEAGFDAVALEGFAIGAHLPFERRMGLADVTRATAAVSRACALPLIVDSDAGWEGEHDAAAVVCRLAAAGAAGVVLSSQHLPDAVPFCDVTERERSRRELVNRVAAAARADPPALVMARCDVGEAALDVVVNHVRQLCDAGAYAVQVHGPADDDLARLPAELPGTPLIYVADARVPCDPAVFQAERLEAWGYRGVRNKYHRCYCSRLQSVAASYVSVATGPV